MSQLCGRFEDVLGSVFSLATKRRRAGSLVLTLALFALGAPSCLAEWKKTITCPAGHEYQVEEHDAGAEEYCIPHFSGSLVVKDGPDESWSIKKPRAPSVNIPWVAK